MKKLTIPLWTFLILTLWVTGPLRAEPFRPDFSAGLDLKYSDNVIYIYNLTTFATTTDSDFFYEPYLVFRLKKKDPLYSQKLSFFFSSDFYSKYNQLNYQTYSLLFDQGIGENAFLTLKYSLNPYLFVGEEEVTSPGQNTIDTGQNYRLQTFTLSADKDFSQKFNLYLFGKESLKDFNTPLAFRTSISNTFGGDLTFHPDKLTLFLIGFSYEINESKKGAYTIGATTLNDDTDYTSPGISILGIRRLTSADSLRVKYIFKTRNYTTPDPAELLHYGRNDRIHNLAVSNTLKFASRWSWKIGYELFKRDSNQSYAVYTENSFTTGIEYLF